MPTDRIASPPPQSSGLRVFPIKRGLAEELGARDRHGRGWSFDQGDIGLDVTDHSAVDPVAPGGTPERVPLPPGHEFFPDCVRESWARLIRWSMSAQGDSWFITLTFKGYVSTRIAHRLLNRWLSSLCDAHRTLVGARGLRWFVAQEWQLRDVIHFHLILSGVRLDELSRKRWEHRWEGIGGGFARIYPAREKAAPYLAKYCSKAQGGEMRQGGTWRGLIPQRSTSCCRT